MQDLNDCSKVIDGSWYCKIQVVIEQLLSIFVALCLCGKTLQKKVLQVLGGKLFLANGFELQFELAGFYSFHDNVTGYNFDPFI